MRTKILLASLFPAVAAAQGLDYDYKYTPCLDYYSVGESRCQPPASTPVRVPQPVVSNQVSGPSKPISVAPETTQTLDQKVDKYLENYGKPPREFVEFYLNPTQENALKWVTTYNKMIEKTQDLSHTWSQADALYQQALARGQANGDVAALMASTLSPSVPQVEIQPSQAASLLDSKSNDEIRLGAFAQTATSKAGGVGVEDGVQLTYFFSKTCPYCAKMTPNLSNIFNEMSGKLALTCVDVTPLSAAYRPEPANIEGKLPCQWRLPEDGEVERLAVKQTPTLFIARRGGEPLRLSGYVPPAELKAYITGQKATSGL